MILQQLQIAEEIVQIAFAATIGALALGLALAFGLGGRPVAHRLLEDAYGTARAQKEQMKDDIATGRDRAQEQAGDAQSQGGGQAQDQGQVPVQDTAQDRSGAQTYDPYAQNDPAATQSFNEPRTR